MKSESFTTIIIEAEPGFVLTQSDNNVALCDRILATKLALGKFDSPDNYIEITQEEADEIKRNQEAEHAEQEGNPQ